MIGDRMAAVAGSTLRRWTVTRSGLGEVLAKARRRMAAVFVTEALVELVRTGPVTAAGNLQEDATGGQRLLLGC